MNRRELLVWTIGLPVVLKTYGAAFANPFIVPGRTYDALVLNLDGSPDKQGDVFDHSTTLVFEQSLPVFVQESGYDIMDSASSYCGQASMRLERGVGRNYGDRYLYAYLNLNNAPERIRAALPLLSPSVAGIVSRREGAAIKHAEIKRIMLHSGPNSDRRIRPLGENVKR